MNKNFKVKKNDGISLLEIIVSLTLLATVVPIFFGIFFSNLDIENDLSLKNKTMEVADDLRCFIKISNYSYIYNLATGNKILGVKNVEEDEIFARKFEKYNSKVSYDYVCRISLIPQNDLIKLHTNIDDSCAIPIWCEVFYTRNIKKLANQEPNLGKCKIKFEFPTVKTR